jgi:hypothetical protein
MQKLQKMILPRDDENVTKPKNNHQTKRRKVPE